jgi:DNA-directed RNA polymerase subunit F
MIGKEVLERKAVSLAHVKHFLESRDTTKAATFEQTQSLDYAQKLSKVPFGKAKGMFNNLLNIDGVDEELASKVVDILPEDVETLKMLLPKNSKVAESNFSSILDLVKTHSKH